MAIEYRIRQPSGKSYYVVERGVNATLGKYVVEDIIIWKQIATSWTMLGAKHQIALDKIAPRRKDDDVVYEETYEG